MTIRYFKWIMPCVLLALASGCTAQGYDPALVSQLAQIRRATESFTQIERAEAAGYGQFMDCTHEPGHGAMGIHFVNGDLAGDTVLDLTRPEALLYAPDDDEPSLTAVEYIVFEEAWQTENSEPPVLMGQPFTHVPSPNRYDLPPFYALHVWVWKPNPNGLFAEWNPDVLCPDTGAAALHSHAAPQ